MWSGAEKMKVSSGEGHLCHHGAWAAKSRQQTQKGLPKLSCQSFQISDIRSIIYPLLCCRQSWGCDPVTVWLLWLRKCQMQLFVAGSRSSTRKYNALNLASLLFTQLLLLSSVKCSRFKNPGVKTFILIVSAAARIFIWCWPVDVFQLYMHSSIQCVYL